MLLVLLIVLCDSASGLLGLSLSHIKERDYGRVLSCFVQLISISSANCTSSLRLNWAFVSFFCFAVKYNYINGRLI